MNSPPASPARPLRWFPPRHSSPTSAHRPLRWFPATHFFDIAPPNTAVIIYLHLKQRYSLSDTALFSNLRCRHRHLVAKYRFIQVRRHLISSSFCGFPAKLQLCFVQITHTHGCLHISMTTVFSRISIISKRKERLKRAHL